MVSPLDVITIIAEIITLCLFKNHCCKNVQQLIPIVLLFYVGGNRWRCNRWMCDDRDRDFDYWKRQWKQRDRRGRYDDDDDDDDNMRGRRRNWLDDDEEEEEDDGYYRRW